MAEVAPLSVVIGPTDTRVVEDVDEAVKLECVVNARYVFTARRPRCGALLL